LVSGCDATVHGGNLVMVGALSFNVVVVGANEPPPVLYRLVEGCPKLPSLLDAVRNSSVESSIVAATG
jgi:hypothetical protein